MKTISALIFTFFASSLNAQAAGYEPSEIYRALRVPAEEACNDTEQCKDAYVQSRSVGGLTCLFTVHSRAGSLVEFHCSLTRVGHDAIYKALKVEERSDGFQTVKAVGGLSCSRENSFFGGFSDAKAICSLRR